MREIKTLTIEEIRSLDVAAAQRLIGENTILMSEIEKEIGAATVRYGNAKNELSMLKSQKQTLIEINRALKTITQN